MRPAAQVSSAGSAPTRPASTVVGTASSGSTPCVSRGSAGWVSPGLSPCVGVQVERALPHKPVTGDPYSVYAAGDLCGFVALGELALA